MAPTQQEDSLFHLETISQYVSLPPAALNDPLPAICAAVFSPLLLSYYPPAKGVVLAYNDVQLSDAPPPAHAAPPASKKRRRHHDDNTSGSDDETQPPGGPQLLCKAVDEYAAPFLWATASLLVWRPRRGAWITARVTHQSRTHVTLAHLNTFPVSVLRDQMPADWAWHEEARNKKVRGWDGRVADEGGWWVGADGERVPEEVLVRIRDWDGRMDGKSRGKGFLRIEGSLVGEAEEGGARAREAGHRVAKGALRKRGSEHGEQAMEVD